MKLTDLKINLEFILVQEIFIYYDNTQFSTLCNELKIKCTLFM